MKKISLPIRFGIVMATVLIAYFLIISQFDLHDNPLFSLFNVVITGFGIYETIYFTKILQGENFTYANGFTAGLVSGFIATIVFTFFFLFYATEINETFLSRLQDSFHGNYKASIGLISFVVAIMGFATTVVLTFSCMQYLKNSTKGNSN